MERDFNLLEKKDDVDEKKEGYNVELHILFSRHAEKDAHSGGITEKGARDAQKLGSSLKRLSSMKGYDIEDATHSGHKRPARTARLVNDPEVPLDKFGDFDPNSSEATQNILPSSVDRYSEAADKKYEEESAGNFASEYGGVEYFARLGEQKYDDDTPSSAEMSQMAAKDLLDMVEESKHVPSGTKRFKPNIVHSGIFEHFIIDLLDKRGEKELVESIGGPLGFLGTDDLRVYIKRMSPTEASICFRFRERDENGKMKYVDLSESELRRLAGIED